MATLFALRTHPPATTYVLKTADADGKTPALIEA